MPTRRQFLFGAGALMALTAAELIAALKQASVTSWLRNFLVSNSSSQAIGRFPGTGSAQNDNFPYADNVDNAHPARLDYVLPQNFQRLISAKLSIHLELYRTYSSFNVTATGGTSNNHNHNHSHSEGSHSHSHKHGLLPPVGTGDTTVGWLSTGGSPGFVLNPQRAGVDNVTAITDATNANGAGTGADATGQSADHTHTVSGASFISVAEGTSTTIASYLFDGVDQTATLGGAPAGDVVELDVTQVLPIAVGVWHTLTLTPAAQGRVVALLRLSYYADNRVAA